MSAILPIIARTRSLRRFTPPQKFVGPFRSVTETKTIVKPLQNVKAELHITDKCAEQLNRLSDKHSFLRVSVEGGGCSGFQYKFDLDTQVRDDDKYGTVIGARGYFKATV